MSTQYSPSSFQYQPSSPLETLVRRTSAKRANNISIKTQNLHQQQQQQQYSYEGSTPHNHTHNQAHGHYPYHSSYQNDGDGQYQGQDTRHGAVTPPRQGLSPTQSPIQSHPLKPPSSPLLHAKFSRGRDSASTMDSRYTYSNSNNSYLDMEMDPGPRDSVDSRHTYKEGMPNFQYDAESVYSTDTALRDSWQSSSTVQQQRSESGSSRHLSQGARAGGPQAQNHTDRSSSHAHRQPSYGNSYDDSMVPTVVITSDDFVDSTPPPMDSVQLKHAGKSPVVKPAAPNFSRPMRPSAVPVLMPAEEEKQKVLERNAGRRPRQGGPESSVYSSSSSAQLPSPYSPTSPGDYFNHPSPSLNSAVYPQPHSRSQSPAAPLTPESYVSSPRSIQGYNTPPGHPSSPAPQDYHHHHHHQQPRSHPSNSDLRSTSPSMAHSYPSPSSSRPTSPSGYGTSPQYQHQHQRSTSRGMSPSPTPSHQYQPSPVSSYGTPTPDQSQASLNRAPSSKVQLPRRPPSLRPGSPVSLYSRYSFYQLDSPSPNGSTHFNTNAGGDPEKQTQHKKTSSTPLGAMMPDPSVEPETKAHHFLQLGIQHHEANRLTESAVCFQKSATEDGGCGAGMLMYGLTLRHGWGCEKNEKTGFKWLRKAAENAVVDLESARKEGGVGIDKGAVRAELIIAIYEVGQCFFHGWGVSKDQKMAVSYYRVAARLGDADAQNDLGFCLANGKGCKKDRKEAAKWYRAAVAQGQSDVGLAWIHKEKFQ
ncbi:hypothetical protein AAF712_007353 [Marasmius tenuissimus]|uniref:HCP-like protein n=1 Tax=Marasmius tenuissimus TaxID=585030 RepID=A0ABR2ZZI0_9AGAR